MARTTLLSRTEGGFPREAARFPRVARAQKGSTAPRQEGRTLLARHRGRALADPVGQAPGTGRAKLGKAGLTDPAHHGPVPAGNSLVRVGQTRIATDLVSRTRVSTVLASQIRVDMARDGQIQISTAQDGQVLASTALVTLERVNTAPAPLSQGRPSPSLASLTQGRSGRNDSDQRNTVKTSTCQTRVPTGRTARHSRVEIPMPLAGIRTGRKRPSTVPGRRGNRGPGTVRPRPVG